MSALKLRYYTSLWNYIYHDEPRSLEAIVRDVAAQGFGVELWPFFFSLDPYRPALQTRPDAVERGFEDLFDPEHREPLGAAVRGVPTAWHSRGVGERPMRVTTFEDHAKQIDTAALVGSSVISVHDIGETLTNARVADDVALARRVLDYAGERGVKLALETGDFDACRKATGLLADLGICLDPAYIHTSSPHGIEDYLEAFADRICYLHLYDATDKGGHYTPGTGHVPENDWLKMLRFLEQVEFDGPAVFEIHPPPRKPDQTALEAVFEARDYVEGLLAAT